MKAIFLHMIDGLVEFSDIDKRATRHVASILSNLQLQLPSISIHPDNLFSILFAFVLLNVSLAFAKPPEFTNCPTSPITNSHCNVFSFRFQAVDPDGDSVRYELASGPGYIDSIFGNWTWRDAKEVHVGQKLAITVRAVTARGKSKCTAEIQVTNQAPVLTRGCGLEDTVLIGRQFRQIFSYSDDCGSVTYRMTPLTSGISGTYEIDPRVGVALLKPDSADLLLSQPLTFMITLTDGAGATDSCEYRVRIRHSVPFAIQFGEVTRSFTIHKQIMTVPLLLSATDYAPEIGALDILMSFPSEHVRLDTVIRGELFDNCKWDYFAYIQYPKYSTPNTGDSVVRIAGLKKLYYPDRGPRCENLTDEPISIATLTFSAPACIPWTSEYMAPIRFFWESCGDNVLGSSDGQKLFQAVDVFDGPNDYGGVHSIHDPTTGFPTVNGPQSECYLDTITPRMQIQSSIDFVNRDLVYVGGDCIDITGDINANDFQYELADLVMFIDYFHVGLSAFGRFQNFATLASDINLDETPLTIADLVRMIEIMTEGFQIQTGSQLNPDGGK